MQIIGCPPGKTAPESIAFRGRNVHLLSAFSFQLRRRRLESFALVDVEEVLVGIDAEFAAGHFIAGDVGVVVEVQGGNRPHLVDAAFDALLQGAGLVVAADEKQDFLGVRHRADADGQRLRRDLARVVVEEAGVHDLRVFRQITDTRAGVEGGEGFVEGDMAVNAGAAEEQVDAAVGGDLRLVAGAFGFQIGRHAVENVHVLFRDVDVVEEVVMHEEPVALMMGLRQADVFVHVERHDVLEADLSGLVVFDEARIDAEGGGTGREAENERLVALVVVDGGHDMVGCPFAHLVVVLLDDDLHDFLPAFCW